VTWLTLVIALLGGCTSPVFAQSSQNNSATLVLVMGAVSLAPFILIMLTSFVKISVVLSIVRNALGTQQIPPNQVVTGLAFVLTLFVMMPVGQQIYEETGLRDQTSTSIFSERNVESLVEGAKKGREPMRSFLDRHCHDKERLLFVDLARRLTNEPNQVIDARSFQVIIPAFVISELKEAFQIGFIIFIPFLIIDMVVSNILLALGMMMLSPTTIALPFKILLFVLIDGWFLIVEGLVLGYV
jgi:type III secretion protein R